MADPRSAIAKAGLGRFLKDNPFPNPWTDGLFYREKMRAIHRVAPDFVDGPVLDIGGGSSDLTARLYPGAAVVSLDLDVDASAEARALRTRGDATRLPHPDGGFCLVALFDVLEHIIDDRRAVAEAHRVLAPGGALLISTPHARWRYPRSGVLRGRVRHEDELMGEWGHVRRGYAPDDLDELVGGVAERTATFGGLLVSPFHDISFSGWSPRRRTLAYALTAAPVAAGYGLEAIGSHVGIETGNELVRCYRTPPAPGGS